MAKILPFLQFSFLTKVGFLAIDFFFVLFLIVALRQVYAMNEIISGSGNPFAIKLTAFILLLVAVSLFLTALVIL
ncbi:MAG TPA: DUF5657 family protein [Patescibacteria group bacterium]|nr:DUF5657 family protein [Patescibacteria group bacterium]